MTNKQERFLVMSETEFEAALQASGKFAVSDYTDSKDYDKHEKALKKAEAACRAKEVEYVATISHEGRALWMEK